MTQDLDLVRPRGVTTEPDPADQPAERTVPPFAALAAEGPAVPLGSSRDDAAGLTGARLVDLIANVNRELWLVLSLLAIAAVANHLIAAQKLVLGFYTLPTIFAAFYRGRRHAVLTAVASALLVGFLAYTNPDVWRDSVGSDIINAKLLDLATWGMMLVLTAYAMGTLHERHLAQTSELKQTYHGVLMILRQFISNDKYTENHSYRVSVYAVTIAQVMGLPSGQREVIRAAALLHDIGKLDISRDVLHKAADLTEAELGEVRSHARKGVDLLEPVSVTMGRILPVVLAHHDRFDGTGYNHVAGEDIPLEARIIAVADVYDALTSDRPYRKALPPCEARDVIRSGEGSDFDPAVVVAFQRAYERGMLEVPEIYV
ncbi:MAG: HD-GYP domain-containing protein [Candidatus Krumholzibacteriia bacterium]